MIRLAAVFTLIAGICAGAAYADDTDNDLECVIVGMSLANSQDATAKASGSMMTIYYLGRLDGRTPDLNLEDKMKAALKAATPDNLTMAAKRCGQDLSARGQSLVGIGKDLQQDSGAAATQPQQ